MPVEGPDLRPTAIMIRGEGLVALIRIEVGNPSGSVVDPRLRAMLGTNELREVQLVAKNTLRAIVPPNLARQVYDLKVIDAVGNTVIKRMAYTVHATDCADFSSPSGADCSGCAQLDGCHCVESTTCATVCGDGILRGDKQCDDGNQLDGDGCSSRCTIETGWTCPTPGLPCTRIITCGNGQPGPGKECDDANTRDGDGCSSTCQVERGWTCTGFPSICAPICGDGLVRGDEQCDDGNTRDGDGCSATCHIEQGWACSAEPSICRVLMGWRCMGDPAVCAPVCGDGLIRGTEQCDDGNLVNGDGCSSTCQIEIGWRCTGEPSVCDAICGDRLIRGRETCDDGTTTGGNGCSPTCQVERGWTCAGEPSVCNGICGDGLVRGRETCDDGTARGGRGCSATCMVEAGYYCAREPSLCFMQSAIVFVNGAQACPGAGTVGNPYCSIPLGIVANSAVMIVRPGTYHVSGIDLNDRPLKLIGEPGAVLTAAATVTPALLTIRGGSTATVVGFTLTGAASRILIDSADVDLAQLVIGPGPGAGVDVRGAGRFSMDRTRVTQNVGGGVFLDTIEPFRLSNDIIDRNGMAGANMSVPVLISQAPPGSRIVNTTVADNFGGTIGGNIAAVRCRVPFGGIINTIVYGNIVNLLTAGIGPLCGATYSDIDPPSVGLGNITNNPMFTQSYHISPTSPAVNSGDPTGVVPLGPAPLLDFDGVRRPRGARVDMGALEGRP